MPLGGAWAVNAALGTVSTLAAMQGLGFNSMQGKRSPGCNCLGSGAVRRSGLQPPQWALEQQVSEISGYGQELACGDLV